jgi:hypothetical protein
MSQSPISLARIANQKSPSCQYAVTVKLDSQIQSPADIDATSFACIGSTKSGNAPRVAERGFTSSFAPWAQGFLRRPKSDLWLPLIEPFPLVAAEPVKGFSLHVPPNFELLVLRNFRMLSSLTDFLKPTFRE